MFPFDDYRKVLDEAIRIVEDRNRKGRNSALGFYEGFPHGSQDVAFELHRRVARILGNEKVSGKGWVRREDALDLVNYAAFYVMLLDREEGSEKLFDGTSPLDGPLRTTKSTQPMPLLRSTSTRPGQNDSVREAPRSPETSPVIPVGPAQCGLTPPPADPYDG